MVRKRTTTTPQCARFNAIRSPSGAATIGVASIQIPVLWDRYHCKESKNRRRSWWFHSALAWIICLIPATRGHEASHPSTCRSPALGRVFQLFPTPGLSQWNNQKIYWAGATLAIVASLETLLNIEAVDKIDPKQRETPASRELFAQGIGNIVSGLLGGLPVTAVVVRGSVNINAGAQTKVSAIFHGILLVVCVMLTPTILNMIPLSCLGILLMTGIKLASPTLVKQMWAGGVTTICAVRGHASSRSCSPISCGASALVWR